MKHAQPAVTEESVSAMSARDLIDLAARRAGTQAKLAAAIGYSERVVSNVRNERVVFGDELRRRLIKFALTGEAVTTVPPGQRRAGQKLKHEAESIMLALSLSERMRVDERARAGHPGGASGLVRAALRLYLAEIPEERIAPPPLPGATMLSRHRIDADLLARVNQRCPSIDDRPAVIRTAVIRYLDQPSERSVALATAERKRRSKARVPAPAGTVVDLEFSARLRSALERTSLSTLATTLALGPTTIMAIASEMPVRRGSLLAARLGLDNLDAVRAQPLKGTGT